MVIEEIAGRVVDLGDGQLEVDLGLNEVELGLSELGLGIEDKEYRFGAEFVFALVRVKSFAGQVHGHFCGFQGEFGLFEGMHGVGDFERDALRGPALKKLILALACERIG